MSGNPCGGKAYSVDARGVITVSGVGAPVLGPGATKRPWLLATLANFPGLFQAAARRHNVPASWLPAIATIETGYWASKGPQAQAELHSEAGAAGVMQIMPWTQRHILHREAEDALDPAVNIDMAAQLLRHLLDNTAAKNLPALCGPYNSGKLCARDQCPEGIRATNGSGWGICAVAGYVDTVVAANNTVILEGLLPEGGGAGTLVAVAALAAAGAGAWWWFRGRGGAPSRARRR